MVNTELFDLTDKVVLITGASKGMGQAMAEGVAEHGAKVVISSRKQDQCEETAAAINAKCGAGSAIAIACNIGYKEQLQHLVDETVDLIRLILFRYFSVLSVFVEPTTLKISRLVCRIACLLIC